MLGGGAEAPPDPMVETPMSGLLHSDEGFTKKFKKKKSSLEIKFFSNCISLS